MPFTASHPAAVLLLLRTPLPASALVIGSIAPDLPYYLPVNPEWPTHTAVGVVTVDVLLGALTWVVWHGLLAAPALAVAPAGIRARLVGRVEVGLGVRLTTQRTVLLVVLALAVGAATHVVWDAFSHDDRWGTDHVGLLRSSWGGLPGYRWVQYGSGVVGGLALLAWLARWWWRTPPDADAGESPAAWIWPVVLAVGTASGVIAATAADSPREAGFAGATAGGAAMAAVAIVLAALWHLVGGPSPGRGD